jgi:hypothetical protein
MAEPVIFLNGRDEVEVSSTNPLPTTSTASANAGGITSTKRLLSALGTTNSNLVKGSAGRIYAIQGYNTSAAVKYLKLYNKATAPTVGTDTPVKTIALPPSVGFAFDWPAGYYFDTGIGFGISGASADNDTTALTAGDIVGLNVDYV